MKTIENEIKNLIGANKIKEAISKMVDYVADKDSELQNSLVLLSSQLQSIQSLMRQELIKLDEYNQNVSKISFSALSVCDQLIEQGYFDQEPTSTVQNEVAIKILFLSAAPVDEPTLKIGNEYLDIRRNLRKSKIKYRIMEDLDVDLDTFLETIWVEKPSIIHFAGLSDANGIILNDKNKKSTNICYNYLASSFKLFRETTKCVIFNAGHSQNFIKAISETIPYVIGVKCVNLYDDDAIAFTNGFYTSLAFEEDYEKAYIMGLHNLQNQKPNSPNPYVFFNKSVPYIHESDMEDVPVLENSCEKPVKGHKSKK